MKIVLANNYYYLRGGSERVMFGDQAALRALGHDVRPFAPKDSKVEDGTSYPYFADVSDHSAGGLRNKVASAKNLVYASGVRNSLARFLDEFPADVIHGHNIYGRLTTSILDEAKRRRIPVVLTVHDLKLVCPSYLGLRKCEPCSLCVDGAYWRCVRGRCHKQSVSASLVYTVEAYFNRLYRKYDPVDRFLCPSEFVRSLLIKSGISSERAVYHPNALPIENYSPNYEPGDYLLYAGRLSSEKGIETLLKAVAATKIPLRIAGTGPLEEEIRTLVTKQRLPVTLEGYCGGPKLADLYSHAALTVISSMCYENAPMSVLESFAYGKSVIGARIGGIPELIEDGKNGKLFTPGDDRELASIISTVWSKKEEVRAMGVEARRLVEEKFSMKRRIDALFAVYEQLSATRVSAREHQGEECLSPIKRF